MSLDQYTPLQIRGFRAYFSAVFLGGTWIKAMATSLLSAHDPVVNPKNIPKIVSGLLSEVQVSLIRDAYVDSLLLSLKSARGKELKSFYTYCEEEPKMGFKSLFHSEIMQARVETAAIRQAALAIRGSEPDDAGEYTKLYALLEAQRSPLP